MRLRRRMRGSTSTRTGTSTIHAMIIAGRGRGRMVVGIGRRRRRAWEAAWAPIGAIGWELRQFSIGDDRIAMSRGDGRGLGGIAGHPTLIGSSRSSSRGHGSRMRIEGGGIGTPGRGGFVQPMGDRRGTSTSTSTNMRGVERRWHAHGRRGVRGRRCRIREGFGSVFSHDVHFCWHGSQMAEYGMGREGLRGHDVCLFV